MSLQVGLDVGQKARRPEALENRKPRDLRDIGA